MHQRVDLELCVVEGVRGRLLHLPVDDLPHPRVQAHLGGTERKWGLGDTQGQAPGPAPIPAPPLKGNWVTMQHQMWGDNSVLHPRRYWHWSPGGWGGLQGGVGISLGTLCVPQLGTGRWAGVLPPWVPPLRDAAGRDAEFSRSAGALVRSRPRSTTQPAVPLPAACRGFLGAGYPLPTAVPLPNSSPNCHRALAPVGSEPSP